jgi:hypothetical protein
MTAICPAGPPKLRSATRTQVGVASLNDGYGMAPALPTKIDLGKGLIHLKPVAYWWASVRLIGGIATPTIESVVEQHPGFELLQIVRIHAREAQGCCEQARSLGRQLRPRVSAPRTMVAK